MSYGFVATKCYFCGHKETLSFREHYTFCPECSAIYTNMIVIRGCDHIKNDATIALRKPWYHDMMRGKSFVVAGSIGAGIRDHCFECKAEIVADGW